MTFIFDTKNTNFPTVFFCTTNIFSSLVLQSTLVSWQSFLVLKRKTFLAVFCDLLVCLTVLPPWRIGGWGTGVQLLQLGNTRPAGFGCFSNGWATRPRPALLSFLPGQFGDYRQHRFDGIPPLGWQWTETLGISMTHRDQTCLHLK